MPAIAVNPPFPLFADADGQPLDDAYIYIGTANQNPVSNPITVYWDAALTITAAQPIRTSGGYPVYNGTPARFYTNDDYSILVRDKNGAFIYTAASETDFISSEFVDFIQSGTGAVATTVQAKLRETVSVKDFGASSAESASNNKTAFDAALSANPSVEISAESFTIDAVTIPTTKTLFGKGFVSVIVGRLIAGANTLINSLKIAPATGTAIEIVSGADEINIKDVSISSIDHGVNVVVDGTTGLTVNSSFLSTEKYAFLTNNQTVVSPAISNRISIVNSYIKSVQADAIEFNHPNADVNGVIASNNFIETTGTATNTTAGFAYGNANSKRWIFSNNVVLDSRNEAIHIESNQSGGVISGNSIYTRSHGLLTYGAAGNPGAFPIVANNFYSPAKVTTNSGLPNAGIFISYASPNNPVNGIPIVGNVIEGFTYGTWLRGTLNATTRIPNIQLVNNNSFKNNTYSVVCEGNRTAKNRQFGVNFSTGANTLNYVFTGSWSLGKIYSDSTPTSIISNGGYSGFAPSCVDGFGYPIALFQANGGLARTISLFPAGVDNRFFGRVRFECRRSGVADWAYASANVLWDGSTLTVTSLISRTGAASMGAVSGINFTVSGGNLNFTFTITNTTQFEFNWIEFDGEYYDA